MLIKLDKICSSCLSNHVAKRASTRQGRSLAVAAAKVYDGVPVLPELMSAIDEDGIMEGHFAVVFGAVCGALSLDLHPTVLMFLFGSLQTVIASAVRLGHVGPMEAQKLQFVCQGLIPSIAGWSSKMSVDDVHIRWPLVDTVQNCHDTMFSKLFYS
ncbi:hypothetical protein NP493_611g01073 [Ridgeia piscesae]|uniref:Urease accessory protein n=1 Tax=Ridgeia piscesae TaxID=27915 RepID=A0AAD9KUZ3_RIDPI|nr:hypothetical protein NP493_611g01073 [Ridgeia piscesae]